jgi:AmpD protein
MSEKDAVDALVTRFSVLNPRSWAIDATGCIPEARFIPSPNCDERPPDAVIELLVIHNISLPPGEFGGAGVIELFTNRLDHDAHPYYREIAELKVSAHFFIRRGGDLIQFVPCLKRAWHSGVSRWRGRSRCNDYSIGIELEGCDDVAYEEAQYDSLARLTRVLLAAYRIRDIVGHADIAPQRKTDPGPAFDWEQYRALLAQAEV